MHKSLQFGRDSIETFDNLSFTWEMIAELNEPIRRISFSRINRGAINWETRWSREKNIDETQQYSQRNQSVYIS